MDSLILLSFWGWLGDKTTNELKSAWMYFLKAYLKELFQELRQLSFGKQRRRLYRRIQEVFYVKEDIEFGLRRVYRIEEKEEFEKGWHSFVDVQAIRELREGIRYITKYLTKTKNEGQTQVLTLALCWLFMKRTFAVSGDFLEALRAEIKSSRASRLVQTNLQGVEISLEVEYLFIGIFSAERLGIDRNEWRKIITDRDVLLDILN